MTAHVLIVDDNAVNLKLAARVLEAAGYRVARAVDSEAALQLIARELPDLILMDIGLPGLDGLELTRRLKASPGLAGIPVVAMTAFAMKGDEERALVAGCDGYITKPIDTRAFPGQVAAYLAGGGGCA